MAVASSRKRPHLPQEIKDLICEQVFLDPEHFFGSLIDPLKALCLSNKAFYKSAMPLYFRRWTVNLDKISIGHIHVAYQLEKASLIRELKITFGCMGSACTFQTRGRCEVASVADLMQSICNLPNLEYLEAGCCPCHSLQRYLDQKIFLKPYQRDTEQQACNGRYWDAFSRCKQLLVQFAAEKTLKRLTRCRLNIAAWHTINYGRTLLPGQVNPTPGRVDTNMAMHVLRNIIGKVDCFELYHLPVVPKAAIGYDSCNTKDQPEVQKPERGRKKRVRQMHITDLSTPDYVLQPLIGKRLTALHIQGISSSVYVWSRSFARVLRGVAKCLTGLQLERLVAVSDKWADVFRALAAARNLRRCRLNGLSYGVLRDLSAGAPLISRSRRDWQELKTFVEARPDAFRKNEDSGRVCNWIMANSAKELARNS